MASNVLKFAPDDEYEDYSLSHLEKGADYHERFASLPGRKLIWSLEKQAIRSIILQIKPRRTLDFACGTGRITSLLLSLLDRDTITGVDISESMLASARRLEPEGDFRQLDVREAVEELGRESFDLITAFRFFPNADKALRESAADAIAALMGPNGRLVFNNHRNFWSLSYLLRRLGNIGPAHGAVDKTLVDLFRDRGFTVEQRISLGIWPQSDRRAYLLPWAIAGAIERLNYRVAARFHGMGFDNIWVLKKVSTS